MFSKTYSPALKFVLCTYTLGLFSLCAMVFGPVDKTPAVVGSMILIGFFVFILFVIGIFLEAKRWSTSAKRSYLGYEWDDFNVK